MALDALSITTRNPATGDVLQHYSPHTRHQIESVLARAAEAAQIWRDQSVAARGAVLAAVADEIDSRRDELSALVTAEMGKPLAEAAAEVTKCAWNCRNVAERGHAALSPAPINGPSVESVRVEFNPLGAILAVMPWNFPLWQVVRFAAPALIAGNVVLLKHSPNVTGCALILEEIFRNAFAQAGLVQALLIDEVSVAETSAAIIADPRVAAVTVTGSTRAGSQVAAAAGRALKKSVLELGGSDPFIVLDDADLSTAALHATTSRMMCAGQTCIAAKRVLVHADVFDEFINDFVTRVAALRVGDPTDPDTKLGPLARPDIVDQIERQVRESVAMGAKVLTGGHRVDRPGNYYAPTVLTDVTADMPVCREETFGPVAVVFRIADDDEAITIANDTEYGLAASVWSRDTSRAVELGRRIDCGALYVNSFVSSDPRVPFGGVKRSGYGRELGDLGVREFTNARTVWIAGTPE